MAQAAGAARDGPEPHLLADDWVTRDEVIGGVVGLSATQGLVLRAALAALRP